MFTYRVVYITMSDTERFFGSGSVKFFDSCFVIKYNTALYRFSYANITYMQLSPGTAAHIFYIRMKYFKESTSFTSSAKDDNFLGIVKLIETNWTNYLDNDRKNTKLQQLEDRVKQLEDALLYAPPPAAGTQFVAAEARFEHNKTQL